MILFAFAGNIIYEMKPNQKNNVEYKMMYDTFI